MCGVLVGPQNIPWSRSRAKFHEKWPFYRHYLAMNGKSWVRNSFLLIFSAGDGLVKVSWKSDARNCQTQLTLPYFDKQSDRSQPLWKEMNELKPAHKLALAPLLSWHTEDKMWRRHYQPLQPVMTTMTIDNNFSPSCHNLVIILPSNFHQASNMSPMRKNETDKLR